MCRIKSACCCIPLPDVVGLLLGLTGIIVKPCEIFYSSIDFNSKLDEIKKIDSKNVDDPQLKITILYLVLVMFGLIIKLSVLFYDFYRSACLFNGVLKVN